MKMSDVFELPMTVGDEFGNIPSEFKTHIGDKNYWLADFDDDLTYEDNRGHERATAAAHAINCHDKLVSEMERYLPLIEYIEDNHGDIWAEALHGVATGNGYRHAIKTAKGE